MPEGIKSRAFPNAYVDVDEPPNRVPREKALAVVGMVGIACFGLTVLALHFAPTGYDPIRQVVSDYAVGRFAVEMELGFFAGGVGLVALAVAIALANQGRTSKSGASLLVVAGAALFIVGAFPTDIEGAAVTLHGTVHGILSLVVFTLSPVGMLLVSYAEGRRLFWTTASALLAAGSFVTAQITFSLDVAGLAERLFILVLVLWSFTASLRLLKTP